MKMNFNKLISLLLFLMYLFHGVATSQEVNHKTLLLDAVNIVGKPLCNSDVVDFAKSLGEDDNFLYDQSKLIKTQQIENCNYKHYNSGFEINFKYKGISITANKINNSCDLYVGKVTFNLISDADEVSAYWNELSLSHNYNPLRVGYPITDFSFQMGKELKFTDVFPDSRFSRSDHIYTEKALTNSNDRQFAYSKFLYSSLYNHDKNLKKELANALGLKKIKKKELYLNEITISEKNKYHEKMDNPNDYCRFKTQSVFVDWGDEKVSVAINKVTSYLNSLSEAQRAELNIPTDPETVKDILRRVENDTKTSKYVLNDERTDTAPLEGQYPTGKYKVYHGYSLGGLAHGNGLVQWHFSSGYPKLTKDSDIQEGDFVLGVPHGLHIARVYGSQNPSEWSYKYFDYGKIIEKSFTLQKDGYVVKGNTLDGKSIANGDVIEEFDDGRVLNSKYINGKRHSVNKITFANGDTFTGNLDENLKIHGNGTYVFKTPLLKHFNLYKGKWEHGNIIKDYKYRIESLFGYVIRSKINANYLPHSPEENSVELVDIMKKYYQYEHTKPISGTLNIINGVLKKGNFTYTEKYSANKRYKGDIDIILRPYGQGELVVQYNSMPENVFRGVFKVFPQKNQGNWDYDYDSYRKESDRKMDEYLVSQGLEPVNGSISTRTESSFDKFRRVFGFKGNKIYSDIQGKARGKGLGSNFDVTIENRGYGVAILVEDLTKKSRSIKVSYEWRSENFPMSDGVSMGEFTSEDFKGYKKVTINVSSNNPDANLVYSLIY